ncbi:MAG: CYTH domain-containing protein [Bacilli bacterium]|nr:CYTH domain-containing protein [Bacilli bacterium]MDD4795444.1 CYTH domain-containing protein [Bacilli bacterium]
MKNLDKKLEELELKYIIGNEDDSNLLKQILFIFKENGFKVLSLINKINDDDYYDTKELLLYQSGGSLRIRKVIQKDKIKLKGTYKMPLNEDELYSSRTEIEETLSEPSFDGFKLKMEEMDLPVDFSQIIRLPILNSTTKRTDVILEKNGVQVCLSLDDTVYTNYILDQTMAYDKMIEIESVGQVNNGFILNEIHNFITKGIENLSINKQSKYERGIDITLFKYKDSQKDLVQKNTDTYVLTQKLRIL